MDTEYLQDLLAFVLNLTCCPGQKVQLSSIKRFVRRANKQLRSLKVTSDGKRPGQMAFTLTLVLVNVEAKFRVRCVKAAFDAAYAN